MAELFSQSGQPEDVGTTSPALRGYFIPAIEKKQIVDGFGVVIPFGGGSTSRAYLDYGITAESSGYNTFLSDWNAALVPGVGDNISYNLEGMIGPQGPPGRDGLPGVTTIIYMGGNSNFLTALPDNLDQINDLGTAADKLIYTSAYTTVKIVEPDVLGTGTVDGDALGDIAGHAWETNDWSEVAIGISPSIDIVEGNLYTIKIEADGDGDGGWVYACSESPGDYDGGEVYKQQDEETGWILHESGTPPVGYDIWFNTGTDSHLFTPPTTIYQGIGVGVANNGSSYDYRKAMIFTATSSYTLSSLTLTMARGHDDYPGNLTISISNATELYSEATWAETEITSAGRGLLDDTTTAAQQDTLGLGTADVPTFSGVNFLEVSELPDPAVEGEVIRLLSDSRLYFGKVV